jgi:hypothetical protein
MLDSFEHPADCAPDGDSVRVLGWKLLDLAENTQSVGQTIGVNTIHVTGKGRQCMIE